MYGYLFLKKFLGWKRFFFQLDADQSVLKYSADPVSPEVGSIDLAVVMITRSDESKGKCFRLVSKVKEYTVKAETVGECVDWVYAISRAQVKLPLVRRNSKVNFHPEDKNTVHEFTKDSDENPPPSDLSNLTATELASLIMRLRYAASDNDEEMSPEVRRVLLHLLKARRKRERAVRSKGMRKQEVQPEKDCKTQEIEGSLVKDIATISLPPLKQVEDYEKE
jgi:hypothetical protein